MRVLYDLVVVCNKCEWVVVVFFDMEKVFDCVWYVGLFSKLVIFIIFC